MAFLRLAEGLRPNDDSFRSTYRNNPAAFVHDCIVWKPGEGPYPYQYEILEQLPVKKRVCVRGPHGLGKTAFESWIILWFALTSSDEDWKCPTMASAWRQLEDFLWPEVHKWAWRLDWKKIGREPLNERYELLDLKLKVGRGRAFAVASDKASSVEGAHATRLLYAFDESKEIPVPQWDAAEGAFSNAGLHSGFEAFAVAVSTPGEPQGRFYEIQSRRPGYEDWWVRHVTLDECIAAGAVTREWADQRMRQWGEQSAMFQNRVLGEFAASDEDGVIPLSWVEAANERWYKWKREVKNPEISAIGVDIARTGTDKTVLAIRCGNAISELRRYSLDDTMSTAGYIVGIIQANPYLGIRVVIDIIGIGAGVFDRVREKVWAFVAAFRRRSRGRGPQPVVVAFNSSHRARGKDRSGELGFTNKRSEGWWKLREQLDPNFNPVLAFPPDDQLTGDLTAPRWRIMSGGRIAVEGKDEIRKRLRRSTDDGDSVVYACYDGHERIGLLNEGVSSVLSEYRGV